MDFPKKSTQKHYLLSNNTQGFAYRSIYLLLAGAHPTVQPAVMPPVVVCLMLNLHASSGCSSMSLLTAIISYLGPRGFPDN